MVSRPTLLGCCFLLSSFCFALGSAKAAPGEFVEADVEVLWSRSGEADSYYGWAIADVADSNGDGVRDLAVGAPFLADAEGPTGRVDLLSGADGEILWSYIGQPGDLLGYSLADAGDVDGDGTHDVIVGSPGAAGGGRVEVHSGVDGELLLAIPSPDSTAAFGSAVAGGGYIDDDELADLIVGGGSTMSEGGEPDDVAGAVWALSGADGTTLWEVHGQPGDRLGSGAAHVGDLDDDGIADPFVGARDGGGGGGYARVLSGVDGATLLELAPDMAGGEFGSFFVAGVGDLDDDDTVDLYVGDYAASPSGPASGRVHVYSGASGQPLLTLAGEGPGEGLGPGRSAGDVDFDGIPDLLSGAYASSAGAGGAGRVLVFSGVDGHVLRTITSKQAGEQLGFDAVGLGDVDRDGDVDLALSAAEGDYVYLVAGLGGDGPDTGDDTGDDESGGQESGESETGGSGTGGPETDGPESGDESPGSDTPDSGCSCTAGDPTRSFAALGLALLGLLGLRRQSR